MKSLQVPSKPMSVAIIYLSSWNYSTAHSYHIPDMEIRRQLQRNKRKWGKKKENILIQHELVGSIVGLIICLIMLLIHKIVLIRLLIICSNLKSNTRVNFGKPHSSVNFEQFGSLIDRSHRGALSLLILTHSHTP